jgi:hypothetical protein
LSSHKRKLKYQKDYFEDIDDRYYNQRKGREIAKKGKPWTRDVNRALGFCIYFGLAATYSPTLSGSTIGAGELNCSVRNGKR